jgi:hypothetical protein
VRAASPDLAARRRRHPQDHVRAGQPAAVDPEQGDRTLAVRTRRQAHRDAFDDDRAVGDVEGDGGRGVGRPTGRELHHGPLAGGGHQGDAFSGDRDRFVDANHGIGDLDRAAVPDETDRRGEGRGR